jgi:hypothetical protein
MTRIGGLGLDLKTWVEAHKLVHVDVMNGGEGATRGAGRRK